MKIENEDINAGCTILLPTYNRPHYLRRILNYYDSFGEKIKIIVADSSSDENKKLNKRIISSVSNLDIKHLDHYSTELNAHHKFADMANYAEEKYCVLCGDDDFVVPYGVKQSVEFLEKNPDFTVAHGYYISFWLKIKRNEELFCWEPRYPQESIIFSDPKSRLTEHLSNYSLPTSFGVHRADFFKMIYQEVLKSKVDPRIFGELLPSMLTLIYGKMKYLDALYAARDNGSSTGGYWPTIRDFIKAGTYNDNYAKFRDCLAMHLSKRSQLDLEESKKVVDKAMSAYLEKYHYHTNYQDILKHKMDGILNHPGFPAWIDGGIRKSYRKLRMRTDDFRCSEDIPYSKYYDDFNKIRRHVLSYSKSDKKFNK